MRCERCGKAFRVTSFGWGYRYGSAYLCSYRCMREMERGETVTKEEKARVDELAEKGMSRTQICEETGLSKQAVGVYLTRKQKKEDLDGVPVDEGKRQRARKAAEEITEEQLEKMKAEQEAAREAGEGPTAEKGAENAREWDVITNREDLNTKREDLNTKRGDLSAKEGILISEGTVMDEGTRLEMARIIGEMIRVQGEMIRAQGEMIGLLKRLM